MVLEKDTLKNFYYSFEGYNQEVELKFIIANYLLSLLGITCDAESLEEIRIDDDNKRKKSNIYFDSGKIVFKSNRNSSMGFCISTSMDEDVFKDSYLSKIRLVYEEIQKVTYNDFNKEKNILNVYSSFAKALNEYDYAVQRGICHWIADSCPEKLEHLLISLEKWSTKTYEGKKVPFAFIVDLMSSSGIFNYIDFLYEEYSATFTDGITSIVELDKDLQFIKYNSLTENNTITSTDITSSPYRFAQVITKFTNGKNKVGVILLTNGDLILIKDAKIELIKRDGNWINFNKDIFVSTVMAVNNNYQSKLISQKLLNELFYTSLDVSFSHSGGLIAVVEDKDEITKPCEFDDIKKYGKSLNDKTYGIVNYIDDLKLKLPPYQDLKSKYKLFASSNMKKDLVKGLQSLL